MAANRTWHIRLSDHNQHDWLTLHPKATPLWAYVAREFGEVEENPHTHILYHFADPVTSAIVKGPFIKTVAKGGMGYAKPRYYCRQWGNDASDISYFCKGDDVTFLGQSFLGQDSIDFYRKLYNSVQATKTKREKARTTDYYTSVVSDYNDRVPKNLINSKYNYLDRAHLVYDCILDYHKDRGYVRTPSKYSLDVQARRVLLITSEKETRDRLWEQLKHNF